MNKKGFTIVEVVIAFSLLTVILLALITFTINYRDKIGYQELKMALLDYKNTMTKLIYDDIISGKYTKIEKCSGQGDANVVCVNFVDKDSTLHPLRINVITENTSDLSKGVYLYYEGINYLLPDSDVYNTKEALILCDFTEGLVLSSYNDEIYHLRIPFYHRSLNISYEIELTIN